MIRARGLKAAFRAADATDGIAPLSGRHAGTRTNYRGVVMRLDPTPQILRRARARFRLPTIQALPVALWAAGILIIAEVAQIVRFVLG